VFVVMIVSRKRKRLNVVNNGTRTKGQARGRAVRTRSRRHVGQGAVDVPVVLFSGSFVFSERPGGCLVTRLGDFHQAWTHVVLFS
jgi:hypothetical protein